MPPTRSKTIKLELPADAATPYAPPEGAGIEDLASLIEAAEATAATLLEDGATAADVEEANRYIAAIEAMETRQGEIQVEQEQQAASIAEARAKLNREKPKEGEDDPDKAKDPAEAKAEDEDDPDKVKDPAEAGADGGVVQTGDVSDPSVNPNGALLVAGGDDHGRTVLRPKADPPARLTGRRSAVAAAAGAGPAPQLPAAMRDRGKAASLIAGSDIKGLTAGAEIDWDDMGKAAENRFKALPQVRPGQKPGGAGTKLNIGSVYIQTNDEQLVAGGGPQGGEFAEADDAIKWAVSHRRLAQEVPESEGSLTAAGGWCAPSETLYDLLDITTDDGLLDVPGITVTRGGVRYALGPDFTAVYVTGNANFTRTEAQAIAGTPSKPMVNIPCPTFTDNRMVVDGLYLSGDILTSRGYPEAYTDYMQKAMKAFAHYVNAASITDQVNLSTLVDLSVSTGTLPATNRSKSATVEILGALELQVTDMRYRNRLSMTQAVEVVAPFWLRGNIRSDLAKRMGWTNPFSVSDADIRAWFAERGATVQFVYDWQDAFTGVAGGFGAATAIAGWPNTANILIYPEGTFVRALDPVIELNAVYDSTLLATNQYVALFMEQGRLTLKRHWDARNLKIDVSPLGNTVAGSAIGPVQNLQGSVL